MSADSCCASSDASDASVSAGFASSSNRFVNGGFAPALEDAGLAQIAPRYGQFIGGEWQDSARSREICNPALGQETPALTTVGEADGSQVDAAVRAARAALDGEWGRMPVAERGHCLFRLSGLLLLRAREFALAETLETGLPIRETRDFGLPQARAALFSSAGWADKLDYLRRGREQRVPGVVGVLIPWHFPLVQLARSVGSALACGQSVVLHPAQTAPVSVLKFMELVAQAGFPAGAVNLVTGGKEPGDALVRHPDLDQVAGQASAPEIQEISRALAGRKTRLRVERGGVGVHLVHEDAALDQAVEGVLNAAFSPWGQLAGRGSRLLLQEGIAEEFLDRLRARVQTLIVGNPLDQNTDWGPIHAAEHLQQWQDWLAGVGSAGVGSVWQSEAICPGQGRFFPPTIVADCLPGQEPPAELLGPVLTTQTFRTEAEAIAQANQVRGVTSASLWTENAAKMLAQSRSLRVEQVWANTSPRQDPASPTDAGGHGLEAYLV